MPKPKKIQKIEASTQKPKIMNQEEEICDYEKIRLENIRQNKLMLESLGLKPKISELDENHVIYPPTNQNPAFDAFYQRPESFNGIKIDKSIFKKTLGNRKSRKIQPKIDENSSLSEIRRSLRIQNKEKSAIDYTSRSYDALFLGPDAFKRKRSSSFWCQTGMSSQTTKNWSKIVKSLFYISKLLGEFHTELRIVKIPGERSFWGAIYTYDTGGGGSPSHSTANSRLDPSTYVFQRPTVERENVYGHVSWVPVGQLFQSRMECCYSGIHRPTVAGIHGGPEGAYSVVLNGGYEDDVDYGDMFTYTGEGGRDLKGTKANPKNLRAAPQSRDQELVRGNLALAKNVETRLPVRVVRGYKLNNRYSPMTGYRYDGLYTVEKFWQDRGLGGFNVYRFAFKRVPDQEPLPDA